MNLNFHLGYFSYVSPMKFLQLICNVEKFDNRNETLATPANIVFYNTKVKILLSLCDKSSKVSKTKPPMVSHFIQI